MRSIFYTIILMIVGIHQASGVKLIEEGEIGWVRSDLPENYASFRLISKDDELIYIKIIGDGESNFCYLPLKGIETFTKYLEEIYRKVSSLNYMAEDNMLGNITRELPAYESKVYLIWQGKMFYNEKKTFDYRSPLSATWEFYRSDKFPSGSYILFTADAADPKDSLEQFNFKLWITVGELRMIIRDILSKNNINKWVNAYMLAKKSGDRYPRYR